MLEGASNFTISGNARIYVIQGDAVINHSIEHKSSLANNRSTGPLLEFKLVPYNKKINDDSGSGAWKDLSTWKPALEPNWYYLGPAATNGSNDAVGLIVRDISDDGSVLRPVGDWEKVWDDSRSGKYNDYSLWRGVPRHEDLDHYVVIGGFFVRSHNKPTSMDTAGIMAVRKDVLTIVDSGKEVWNDAGTRASKDGAVWNISVSGYPDVVNHGAFIPVEGHHNPPENTYAIDRSSYTKEQESLFANRSAGPLLEIKSVPYNQKINNDSGSGARKDLSTWKPVLDSGWCYLGPAATNGSNDAVGLIVRDISDDGTILRPVGDWEKVWDDSGSGKSNDYSLWRGVPRPEDQSQYVVIGGFFVRSHSRPTSRDTAGIMAIRKDFLTTVTGKEVWNDAGTRAAKNGSIWNISDSGHLDVVNPGAFIPAKGHNTPPKSTYAIDRIKVKIL